ncbi:MAG: hypothetical protein RJA59_2162 [Pseudomonadota bacterium]
MTAPARRCPTCGGAAGERRRDGTWPFCSDRCRLADLGRWLGETYRIPGERAGDGAAAAGYEDGDEEGRA